MRVYLKDGEDPSKFQPGDYGQWPDDKNNWYAETPNGYGANLSRHKIVEHEDGTISVTPSILVTTTVNRTPVPAWHGYLTKGVWKEC